MTEYERVREEALLTDEEIKFLRDAANINENKLLLGNTTILSEKAIAQAQLDKALKTDGIEIRTDDQSLPTNEDVPEQFREFMCGAEDDSDNVSRAFYLLAQQDMLKAGFVKVIPKGR